MHVHSFYIVVLASYASALGIHPGIRASGLRTRSNPSFTNANSPGGRNVSLSSPLVKRTDPTIYDGDYGATEGFDRKDLLEGAFPDVYSLVVTTLNHWDDIIFDHWFPPRDKEKVQTVLQSIIKSQDAPPGDIADDGADILKHFFITPVDTLDGTDNDLCKKGADAYTINYTPQAPNPPYAICHFCPATYENLEEELNPPTLDDIELEKFKFGNEYRITDEMEPIAATVLHEITHFNSVGKGTELLQPDVFSAIITDVGGPNPKTDYGQPYWAWQLRGQVDDNKDPCLKNADSYVWFALESYWTFTFKDDLKGQGGYFNPPKKPDTD